MNKLAVTTALFLTATTANASGIGTGLADPQVTPPAVCTTWTRFIPLLGQCHTQFDYVNPEGDEPRRQSEPEREEPEEEEQCK